MSIWSKLGLLLSQLGNVLFFRGDPDESISARMWRTYSAGGEVWAQRIDNVLGKNHCRAVYLLQQKREEARRSSVK